MATIFLSYRREDTIAYAGRLYDWISPRFGAENIFMDLDSIKPGQDFVEILEKTIQSCDALIVLIGKQWLTSTDEKGHRRLDSPEDFVRLEIAAALKRKIQIIPVLVGGASMPRFKDLPHPIASLTRRQAVEVSDLRWQQDINELMEALERTFIPSETENLVASGDQPSSQDDQKIETFPSRRLAYKLKQRLIDHDKCVMDLAFSPNGRWLATADTGGNIWIREVNYSQEVKCHIENNSQVCALQFSPDGSILASGGFDKKIFLFTVDDGKNLESLVGHSGTILSLAFNPSGETLASAGYDGTIRLWDVSTAKCQLQWASEHDIVHSLAISPDGRFLASGGRDSKVRIWDFTSGNQIACLGQHTSVIYSLKFSPDGSLLASAGRDTRIILWETDSWKSKQIFRMHKRSVLGLSFSSDGGNLISSGADDTIRIWDLEKKKSIQNIECGQFGINALDLYPNGELIASGGTDGSIKYWETVSVASDNRFIKNLKST